MRAGRKRKLNPNIPNHIDQMAIPTGVYFDHRGEGVWYQLYTDEAGKRKRRNICDARVTLAELHEMFETQNDIPRDTLQFVCREFHTSAAYKNLADSTQKDYDYCRDILLAMPTRLNKKLGELDPRRFTSPLIQRVIDKIAAEGTPSKAAHVLRYLRRLLQWSKNRGFVVDNPARGIEAPKERKLRRLPSHDSMLAVISFAQERGKLMRGHKGAVAPYLWFVMEISYLCRLRGIETITLTDANELKEGILTNRRKGSRDNIVLWSPRLRAAWSAAQLYRDNVWEYNATPTPLSANKRTLIVSATGLPLSKSGLDTAWQRMMKAAIEAEIITEDERFGLHDFKRRGITDTPGTRADKQLASGHKEQAMLDIYDLSLPTVNPSSLD